MIQNEELVAQLLGEISFERTFGEDFWQSVRGKIPALQLPTQQSRKLSELLIRARDCEHRALAIREMCDRLRDLFTETYMASS